MKIETSQPINIGIEERTRKEISDALGRLLADTYTLYVKTHNFHWNVTGPFFQSLHQMFETQYSELAEAVDLIAERIRALGFFAPASYHEFSQLTSIREETAVPEWQDMIRSLIQGHETVVRTARGVFPLAEQANDQASVEVVTKRMETHEKTAWMLRSLLEEHRAVA